MLTVETSGSVLRLTLARPEVRNALDEALIARLSQEVLGLSPEVRVVVIEGQGKSFCAGGDLDWMRRAAGYTEEQNYRDAMNLADLYHGIVACPAVVIAKVHGAAMGGGCGLVAACDVGIAARDAKFSFSEVKLGLVAATISPIVLPKIGAGHARALFATGEVFDADRALTIGLVHQVVEPGDLDAAVGRVIDSVLASGPLAVAASKRLTTQDPLSKEDSARLLARTRAGSEAREGIEAFLQKRPASFRVER
ncbi:MAG: enoyl-CoA hydratase/isomerase family protein [Fimbriimonadaceae bacterium]|nr:enoyl-CoA hydratase/isomerase family protein [Fimbriimonadaceae bacterium]